MDKIWLSSPHMGGEEFKYVTEAFDTNWIAPIGPHINKFEEDISSYIGGDSVAALSSGTAAIHLALMMLNVGEGDEVICSSFTFAASANPIIYQKATPVFIDSEEETWNMSPEYLEQAIKDRISKGKKPKAIILVYLYGNAAKNDELFEVAEKYDIPVIEDAAEALGATYKGKSLGTFGEIGVFSFNGNKIITTSGGGAIVSSNKGYIDKAKFLSTQARDAAVHYQHSEIGYNYRMSNVSAAIGIGQMKVLDKHIEYRRNNYELYKKELENLGVEFVEELEGSFSNRWLTCVIIDPKKTGGKTREDIRIALEKVNVESRPLWKPMHMQPVFEEYPFYGGGVSEMLFEKGLCLPSGSNLTDEDRKRVTDNIKKALTL
ncbi:MAG: aminotransferase class I/II-fold pyridoxal phosphate-dependent enzyme [Bacteroidota bacterium]